ncbi:MAG: hypothetical protein J6O51_02075 [Bacteroidales bacterium]|nr:hypothetical protein [Bacteroidales bacterium]
MKKFLIIAAVACLSLLASCTKEVTHTGDETRTLYGIWRLSSKSIETPASDGTVNTRDTDYSSVHFYLGLYELPIPHAVAKKGSFTAFDLDDVDVDFNRFTYNADQKKISFSKIMSLTEGLKYNMTLMGTFDIVELSKTRLVIKQQGLGNIATIYSYTKESEEKK